MIEFVLIAAFDLSHLFYELGMRSNTVRATIVIVTLILLIDACHHDYKIAMLTFTHSFFSLLTSFSQPEYFLNSVEAGLHLLGN